MSVATIAGWERGGYAPLPRHRPRLAKALKVSVIEVDRMIDPHATPMVLNGHRVPTWLNHYESLVLEAGRLAQVEKDVVPALLQTKAYAEAIERSGPLPFSEQQVTERVDVRLARQRVLHREPDPLESINLITEAVLRDVVGGRDVMIEQLDHLLDLAELPNVEVRIVPPDGTSANTRSSFELLMKPGETEPFMAVTLSIDGARYIEHSDLVPAFATAYGFVSAAALSPTESARRIHDIRESYR